jgi:hypothetical protein
MSGIAMLQHQASLRSGFLGEVRGPLTGAA